MKQKARIFFDFIPVLLAFLLPFGGLHLSALVLLWLFFSFFCIEKDVFVAGLKNRWFQVLAGFFVIHLISAALSSNRGEAVSSVEIKLSFLAFPYFLFLFRQKPTIIRKILVGFVSGCFFAFLVQLARAMYYYLAKDLNYFYYTDFSYFLHPGYFSMYMLFAWVILQLVYPAWFGGDAMLKWLRYVMSLIFIVGIFMCASKIGIIAFFIVQFGVIMLRYKHAMTIKRILAFSVAVVIIGLITYKLFPTPFDRLLHSVTEASSNAIDKTSGESTAVRILIWKECFSIIGQYPLFGVGAGDVSDALFHRYEAGGLTGALEHHLNAHNQFFQTFIGLGIIGFLILLALTFGTFIFGFIKNNYILCIFSLIVILNFLVESMLQRQEGVLFFAYFLCLLLLYNPQAIAKENKLDL